MTVQWPEEVELWKDHRERRQKKNRRKKQRNKRNHHQSRLERDVESDFAAMKDHMRAIKQEGGEA